jgi:YHS domain-containing protein
MEIVMSLIRWSSFASMAIVGLAACRDAPASDGTSAPPAGTVAASPSASVASVAPVAPVAPVGIPTAGLTRVEDPSTVCMVNDQYMGKAQIPTAVAGKTYFGCCAMCKEKLEKNESARMSVDPTTGKPVDKALAIIARDESGKVFYFQDEASMKRYRR